MKKLVLAATVVFVLAGAAIAGAQVFDEETGTATVMANGGTAYEDHAVGPISVSVNTTVASVTVPAGRYEISAKAWADRTIGSETFVQCGFVNNIADNDNTRAGASTTDFATLVAQGVEEFETETTIDYACASDATVEVHRVSLLATTVSAIDAQ